MDQLKRAWDLLEPGEHPPAGYCRAEMIVAVEGVLLGRGLMLALTDREYGWVGGIDGPAKRSPDRLTAACNALEAVRKANG